MTFAFDILLLLRIHFAFLKLKILTGGLRSTFVGNSALLPYDVIDLAMLPAQRFWREIVSLLDVV